MLVAYSYLRQAGGMYASIARDIVHEGIMGRIDKMSSREKKDYEEILANVKIQDAMRAETKKAPQ